MNRSYILSVFLLFSLIVTNSKIVYSNQPILYAASDAGIGEVRTSILKPADFVKIYGPDWELLSPRDVSNLPISQYLHPSFRDKHGKYILPDARGKFLRMANNDAKGDSYDPDARVLGSYQKQAVPSTKHKHHTTLVSNGHPDSSGDRIGSYYYLVDPRKHGAKYNYSTNEASIGSGVDNRPKNIAMNFYIRVDCKTGGKCQP